MKAEAWRGLSFKGKEHLFWKSTNLELRELGIFQDWSIKMDLVFMDSSETLLNLEGIRLRPKSGEIVNLVSSVITVLLAEGKCL